MPKNQFEKKRLINKYSYNPLNLLGEGCSGSVYQGLNEQNQQECAIKIIQKRILNQISNKSMIICEIQFLKLLKNKSNILQLYDCFITSRHIYLISQRCTTDLMQYIHIRETVPQPQAIKFIQGLIKGYKSIYEIGIIHRDLKPSNILLKQNQIKIADFGFSTFVKNIKQYEDFNVGSPLYMSLEALDIWSIGLIFYEMLVGRSPWNARNQKELIQQLKSFDIQTILPSNICQDSINFLRRCLEKNVTLRMKPDQLFNFVFQDMYEKMGPQQCLILSIESKKCLEESSNKNHKLLAPHPLKQNQEQNNFKKQTVFIQENFKQLLPHHCSTGLGHGRLINKQNLQKNLQKNENNIKSNQKQYINKRKTSLQVFQDYLHSNNKIKPNIQSQQNQLINQQKHKFSNKIGDKVTQNLNSDKKIKKIQKNYNDYKTLTDDKIKYKQIKQNKKINFKQNKNLIKNLFEKNNNPQTIRQLLKQNQNKVKIFLNEQIFNLSNNKQKQIQHKQQLLEKIKIKQQKIKIKLKQKLQQKLTKQEKSKQQIVKTIQLVTTIKYKEQITNDFKKHFVRIVGCQIHFCRFLYKLLMKIIQNFRQQIDKKIKEQLELRLSILIFDKLSQIESKRLSKSQQLMKQWFQSKQYKKTLKFISQYKIKYENTFKLNNLKFQNQLNKLETNKTIYKSIIYLYRRAYNAFIFQQQKQTLRQFHRQQKQQKIIKNKNHQTSTNNSDQIDQKQQIYEQSEIMKIKQQIMILDSLITLKLLLQLQDKKGWEGFQKISKIQNIVEGQSLKFIQKKHIIMISNKLAKLKMF